MNEFLGFTPWRDVLVEKIGGYFSPQERIHGLEHTKEVERGVIRIAQEPEYAHLSLEMDVLRAAALLHDIGYAQKEETWGDDMREHVEVSMRIASEELRRIPHFQDKPEKVMRVLRLILSHDNTNFLFPIKSRGGRPAITKEWVAEAEREWAGEGFSDQDENFGVMLAILKEADGLLATGREGARRTMEINLAQGLPLFARGDPLRAWMWGESVIGSLRLAAKRALLDAQTESGKRIAWEGYLAVEKLIEEECLRNGVPYQQEIGLKELESINKRGSAEDIEIVRVFPWEEMEGILRRISLYGDPTLFPYANARIESEILSREEIYPLSLYALKGKIELHQRLREMFLASYALDFLDLSGIIQFKTSGGVHLVSPPIVEASEHDGNKKLLVDGLHRNLSTDILRIDQMRSILISKVPKHFPLVPLPVSWNEVTVYNKVPDETRKRDYRFSNLDEFPDVSWFTDVEITEENFRYFFYRVLDSLGSGGIREPGGEE